MLTINKQKEYLLKQCKIKRDSGLPDIMEIHRLNVHAMMKNQKKDCA